MDKRVSDAATLLVQNCFNALAGMNPKEQQKPDDQLVKVNQIVLTDMLFEMKQMLIRSDVCAAARNAVIGLLMKNLIHMDNGLPRGWSWRFVEDDGLLNLLKVACNIPEQYCLPVTKETPEHLAVCLARLYDDMMFDKYRSIYKEITGSFLQLRVALVLLNYDGLAPLQVEVHNATFEHLSVALDAIVQTLSKRDRCSEMIRHGVPVLRKLYDSSDDLIKVKALVGLCKCASCSGTDVSMRPFGEESLLMLAKVCRKFLLNEKRNLEVRRYAAEALSYLTLDADVKEYVVSDDPLILSLIDLAKSIGELCMFSVSTILVNLTNAYDKKQAEPELIKLAKFSKHHVPERHPKDAEEFVDRRIDILVKEGAASACVALSNTTSPSCRELLARALFALCQKEAHRGVVVQEGGGKVLVKLATDNTQPGRLHAAQAIAKISITINPEIAFPGQRCHEIIRPLGTLLLLENTALQNYESLLALTNLASLSESIRLKIYKEKLLPLIEEYWYMQDQPELRAAAAELYLNLLYCKEVSAVGFFFQIHIHITCNSTSLSELRSYLSRISSSISRAFISISKFRNDIYFSFVLLLELYLLVMESWRKRSTGELV
ncbi:unnamed protein product [Soboliphyme baturini]|uniref:UNC45-central domain-containing protein n=1 Tax=Soboliphyme baturini TaxID=241478 RepID=A0A183ITH5_9BILA|nr:unnamed protein product [Soboliphyme baturini]